MCVKIKRFQDLNIRKDEFERKEIENLYKINVNF